MKSFTDITAQLGDHAATLRPHQSLVDEALQMQASGKLSGKPSDWVRSSLTTTPLVPLDASMEAALVALDKETAVRPESVLWPAGDAEIS